MKLADLQHERTRTATAMRTMNDEVKADGDLTAEQRSKWASYKKELETLDEKISWQKTADDLERRETGQIIHQAGTGDHHLDAALDKFSLRLAIAGQVPDLNIDNGRERELSAELQRRSGRKHQGLTVPYSVFRQKVESRVLTTTAPGAGPGSNLIQTDHLGAQYIDLLRAALVLRAMGATVLSGLVGNVDIPKAKVSGTSQWVAENAGLSAADLQFQKVSLTPKHAGALTEVSRNMLLQSSPDIETLLRRDFAELMAQAIDSAGLRGGGANEPIGIIAHSDVVDVSMSSGPTWAKVLEIVARVQATNGDVGAMGWVGNPWTRKKMMQTTKETSDAAGGYIQNDPITLAGFPFRTTSNLLGDPDPSPPVAGELIFGAFSSLLIGIWSEFDLLMNPYEGTAYSKGNVMVRGMATIDIQLRHAESFITVEDMDIT